MLIFYFSDSKKISSYGYISSDDKVLYQLKEGENIVKVDNGLSQCYKDYIVLTTTRSHAVDVSLESREEILNFTSEYRSIRSAKDIFKKAEHLSEDEFITFIKISIALKRWYREIFIKSEKTYKLF